jgi:hypothetical protein
LENRLVHPRLLITLFWSIFVVLLAMPAAAAPRDNAANKKIDEAINQHYLATDFDKAEAILTGTVNACADKCSPGVIAKAWMYVGVVRGSGKQDQKGAKEAFEKAVAADASIKLDDALATPETKKTWESVKGAGTGPTPVEPGKKPPAPTDIAGEMDCTPKLGEVQTRRPIPISCTTEEEAVKGELRYRPFGSERWETVKMNRRGDFFQAEIPCTASMLAGTLRLYVRVQDAAGDTVDTFGTKSKPFEITITPQTDAEPPSFPDKDPPQRCAEEVECPPDFPGCKSGAGARGNKDWGSSCEETRECKAGLACINGSCETAQSCDIDADCATGKCVDGTCQGGGPSGPYKKNWLGVHIGWDLAMMGGKDVCSQASQQNEGYACYYPGTEEQYAWDPQPGRANAISTGIAPATIRVMLSFDRAITPNITLGARAGYAFNGGPPSGKDKISFMPIHGELRGTYWLGQDPLAQKGLRPYVHIGGGLAQVDAKLPVTIVDCATDANEGVPNTAPSGVGQDGSAYEECKAGREANRKVMSLDAYKKLGQQFVALGGGTVFALTPNSGFQLNLNLMFMLPTSGFVIQPSAGYVFGL